MSFSEGEGFFVYSIFLGFPGSFSLGFFFYPPQHCVSFLLGLSVWNFILLPSWGLCGSCFFFLNPSAWFYFFFFKFSGFQGLDVLVLSDVCGFLLGFFVSDFSPFLWAIWFFCLCKYFPLNFTFFFLYNLRSLEDLSFVFYLIFVGFFVMFSLDFFLVSLFGILLSGGLFVSFVFINIFCLILLFFFLEFEAFKGFVFLVLSHICIFLLFALGFFFPLCISFLPLPLFGIPLLSRGPFLSSLSLNSFRVILVSFIISEF